MILIYLILFILLSIGFSRLDNKLGKTVYWKLYLAGLILSMLFGIISGYFIVSFGKNGVFLSSLLSKIAFLLIYVGMLGILIKASCLDKKIFYIGIGIYVLFSIVDIYYAVYFSQHMKEFIALAFGNLSNVSYKTIYLAQIHKYGSILVGIPLIYALYRLILRMKKSTGSAILWGLILAPIYVILILPFDKDVNNLESCNSNEN